MTLTNGTWGSDPLQTLLGEVYVAGFFTFPFWRRGIGGSGDTFFCNLLFSLICLFSKEKQQQKEKTKTQ